jgi:hypothetical protein
VQELSVLSPWDGAEWEGAVGRNVAIVVRKHRGARGWGGVWGVVLDDRSAEHWTAVPDEVCRIFFLHPGGFRSRGVSLLRPRCEACGDLVELVCGGTAAGTVSGSFSARYFWDIFFARTAGAITQIRGGSGGSGGGSGGGNSVNRGGGGGGGGNGGNIVVVYARNIVVGPSTATGVISAKGGDGGVGGAPPFANAGGGGGGGAGGGGWVYLQYEGVSGTATNAIDVSGGTGGAGGNGNGTGQGGSGANGATGGRVTKVVAGTAYTISETSGGGGSAGSGPSSTTGGAGGAGGTQRVSLP